MQAYTRRGAPGGAAFFFCSRSLAGRVPLELCCSPERGAECQATSVSPASLSTRFVSLPLSPSLSHFLQPFRIRDAHAMVSICFAALPALNLLRDSYRMTSVLGSFRNV